MKGYLDLSVLLFIFVVYDLFCRMCPLGVYFMLSSCRPKHYLLNFVDGPYSTGMYRPIFNGHTGKVVICWFIVAFIYIVLVYLVLYGCRPNNYLCNLVDGPCSNSVYSGHILYKHICRVVNDWLIVMFIFRVYLLLFSSRLKNYLLNLVEDLHQKWHV